jgi:HNH endonuclease
MDEMKSKSNQDAVPYGFCNCGCGQETTLVARKDPSMGTVQTEPRKYIHGHNRRKPVRYVEVPTGYQTNCWFWLLAKNPQGYGMCRDSTGKMALAHRAYYELEHGPIPEDLQCDHLCRVPACIRPDHIEPVSAAENVRRGRATKLKPDAVYEIRCSPEKQMVLARRYGVDQSQISRIKNNHTWRMAEAGKGARGEAGQPSLECPGGPGVASSSTAK